MERTNSLLRILSILNAFGPVGRTRSFGHTFDVFTVILKVSEERVVVGSDSGKVLLSCKVTVFLQNDEVVFKE